MGILMRITKEDDAYRKAKFLDWDVDVSLVFRNINNLPSVTKVQNILRLSHLKYPKYESNYTTDT